MSLDLSVNLNKVALLRNSRGAKNPSPLVAAQTCLDAGAYGITLHWRGDNRHTRADDVRSIAAYCHSRNKEFNLEGDLREELIAMAIEVHATQFTLVPVTPGEVTSDHGWRLPEEHEKLAPVIARVKAAGIRTAIFVDPDAAMMPAAAKTGVDRVEIYTEPYAKAFGTSSQAGETARLKACAQAAIKAGMKVNAGHDLNLMNLPTMAREVPEIIEASIGHALVADALYIGMAEAVKRYVASCAGKSGEFPKTE